jgi:hypothetical protein
MCQIEEMLLHGEQNGKRLAARWLCSSGEDGESGARERWAARQVASPLFHVLVISGLSYSSAWTDHYMQPITGRWLTPHDDPGTWPFSPRTTTLAALPSWPGRLDDVHPWGLTRRVSRPYPLREELSDPTVVAAHLGTLQRVTVRWDNTCAAGYWFETRHGATLPATGRLPTGPFQAVCWAGRDAMAMKLGCLAVAASLALSM